jgi:hypothetical protein
MRKHPPFHQTCKRSQSSLCRTLCKPAPVLDLLNAIKKYAFFASEYPLMLTIENHLPVPLQHLLAQVSRKMGVCVRFY